MNSQWTRRQAMVTVAGAGVAAVTGVAHVLAQTKTRIDVYKDPSCLCCGKWVEHMNASGFDAHVVNGDPARIKARYGIGEKLQSCHTAIIGAYVVEGHVPASDVKKFLAQKPAGILGLTIPGMPASAPGMDAMPFQPYTVLSFDKTGQTKVFATHAKA